jgi:hypothetical protein
MPPEILTEFKGVCCKSQDISSGIMELGKLGLNLAVELLEDGLRQRFGGCNRCCICWYLAFRASGS